MKRSLLCIGACAALSLAAGVPAEAAVRRPDPRDERRTAANAPRDAAVVRYRTVDAMTQFRDNAARAAAYGSARGVRTGIAVVELRTGRMVTGGQAETTFLSQSTIKTVIAASLLLRGRMSDPALAARMITHSDDAAASALYGPAGGDGLLPWANHYYGFTLGYPPAHAGWWGMSRVTPTGMARFLAAAYADPATGDWLSTHMLRTAPYAADGFDQRFGLKVADPDSWVKQGWGGDMAVSFTGLCSTGYVLDGQFAVSLYGEGAGASYAQMHGIVTEMALLLFEGQG